jgi:vacuolar-type H+-ATPase subunit I/STV1
MIFRIFGWLSLIVGLLLFLLGIASLPAGGLMFALPFFFLIPGIVLVSGGGFLLFFTRLKANSSQAEKTKANGG